MNGIHSTQSPGRVGGHRHLVYFIDGTWLWPGSGKTFDTYSNIYRMSMLLEEEGTDRKAQIVHYVRGLGGVSGLRKYTAGGFAYGIDEVIADLYVNICCNYQPGDKIYVFGFSRGAVISRALSGLLSVGILKEENINLFKLVWTEYNRRFAKARRAQKVQEPQNANESLDYKGFCWDRAAEIEFLGVFDTVVGGHGLAEVAQRFRLGECALEENVINAVQILAIDETRSFFGPIYWTGHAACNSIERPHHFEQIWMPGVHSDIGGAYEDRSLGNVSLITMIDRVTAKTPLRFHMEILKRDYGCRLGSGAYFMVHDEYRLPWPILSPSRMHRRPNASFKQSIHPIVKDMHKKQIKYKNNKDFVNYHPHSDFEKLPVAPLSMSGKFGAFF